MEVEFDENLIWGDERNTQVFVQARSEYYSLIFRFVRNNCCRSVPSRIVNCYHDYGNDDKDTFDNLDSMHKAIYSSIRRVWPQCTSVSCIGDEDVIVEIYEDESEQEQWRVCHEGRYRRYVESLLPIHDLFEGIETKLKEYDTIDYSSLFQIRPLGGRGRMTLVRPSLTSDDLYVFKGVNFGAFLQSPSRFRDRRDVCYQEIQTICSLPEHPNIISPPSAFVTTSCEDDRRKTFVCGALYPFMEYGSLEDLVQRSKSNGKRLDLMNKALWCYQMASAVYHAHFTAHTFHMNIKPANFVLDANKDLTLIDWERNRTALYTLAPEADGTWDVHEGLNSELKYTKNYQGGFDWGLPKQPKRNVFTLWGKFFPRALEAAEVFSLGRSMWMLLQQVPKSELKYLPDQSISWDEEADDIPKGWKDVIDRCLHYDPNMRIRLRELVEFWEEEKSK